MTSTRDVARTGLVAVALALALAAPSLAQAPGPGPGAVATATSPGAVVQAGPSLAPLVGPGADPPPPWKLATLPGQRVPVTRFAVESVDGERALRIGADGSYGNLVHEFPAAAAALRGGTLRWRWRVDEPNRAADLRHRRSDDTSAKVCVLFDLSLERLPFDEALLMRLARARTGEPLPAATVCYVWDAREAAGTALDNPYSRRVRYLVLRGPESPAGAWRDEQRDLAADFLQLFGDESRDVPRVLAIGVGADADNTGGRSVAHLTRLTLSP